MIRLGPILKLYIIGLMQSICFHSHRRQGPVLLGLGAGEMARWPRSCCVFPHSWMDLIYGGCRQLWDIWLVWHYKAADHTRPKRRNKEMAERWNGMDSTFFVLLAHVGSPAVFLILRRKAVVKSAHKRHITFLWTLLSGLCCPLNDSGLFSPPRWALLSSECRYRNTKKAYWEHKILPAV